MWDLAGGEVPPSGVGRAGNPYLGFLNELESGMYLALSEFLISGGIITRTIVSLSLPLLGSPNLPASLPSPWGIQIYPLPWEMSEEDISKAMDQSSKLGYPPNPPQPPPTSRWSPQSGPGPEAR